MLDGLWIATAAPAVDAALAAFPAQGTVAVIGPPRLARALVARGRAVAPIDAVDPAAGYVAVVAVGVGERDDWAATLAAWTTAVRDGGGVVLVDRTAAVEMARRALCAGLTELEQRVSGRWIVTSGRVCRYTRS